MSTTTRPELSDKNKHFVEKHRFYELKHFCLQYPIWKKAYISLDGLSKKPDELVRVSKNGSVSNPTERCAIAKDHYMTRMRLIEDTARDTDPIIGSYILLAVTEGLSYDTLRSKYDIPCCKEVYYKLFREFFWKLNKARD